MISMIILLLGCSKNYHRTIISNKLWYYNSNKKGDTIFADYDYLTPPAIYTLAKVPAMDYLLEKKHKGKFYLYYKSKHNTIDSIYAVPDYWGKEEPYPFILSKEDITNDSLILSFCTFIEERYIKKVLSNTEYDKIVANNNYKKYGEIEYKLLKYIRKNSLYIKFVPSKYKK
jgi:hypothetical protein